MGFLIPSALGLTALAIPIIIFYMLKLRRQPARVSSLMLWQQVLQDKQANAPWQRLRRNLLLLLQLLILALLVMALARPFFNVEAQVQGNVVLLLDASASMLASDVLPTRFAQAKTSALDLINKLDPSDAVTLIAVESSPRVLASSSTDRAALRRALNAMQVHHGPADWNSALTLAAANAATLPDTTITIISDGAINEATNNEATNNEQSPNPQSPNLPISNLQLPISNYQFLPIGAESNNQGLTALSLRDGPDGPELFLRVFNAAEEEVRRLIEIRVNDQLLDARRLTIPARDSAGLTLQGLPLGTRQVQATLSGSDDLALDDVAWAVRNAAPARVLLVGEGNLFLERALALLPNIQAQRATAEQELPQSRFDLIIFDRTVPDTLPQSNLLFIAPPTSTPLFEVSGTITQPQISRLQSDHALLNYVELNNLHVSRAQQITPPPWSQTLVESNGAPLLLAGQREGQRIALLSFDLHQSDLPLQIDFPILIINLIRWLSPGENLEQGQNIQAGERVNLPSAASADTLLIHPPSGPDTTLPSDQTTFNQTNNLGIYQILAQDPNQNILIQEFAVNLLSKIESDTQPRHLESNTTTPSSSNTTPLTGRLEWWWALALLALAILMIEWWIYWRGETR